MSQTRFQTYPCSSCYPRRSSRPGGHSTTCHRYPIKITRVFGLGKKEVKRYIHAGAFSKKLSPNLRSSTQDEQSRDTPSVKDKRIDFIFNLIVFICFSSLESEFQAHREYPCQWIIRPVARSRLGIRNLEDIKR